MTEQTIVGAFLEVCEKRPAHLFCVHYTGSSGDTAISYGTLLEQSRTAACRLQDWGCGRGDVILIFVKHQPELYPAFVGSMLAGAIPSFMPYPNPKQDSTLFWKGHATLLDRIQPRLLIVSSSMAAAFSENLPQYAHLLRSVEDLVGGEPGQPAPVTIEADDIAFLQHSSGTTGLKKGVMLSHREVAAETEAYRAAIGFTENDVIASWLPLYHDMGLIACLMQTLQTGSTLVALDPFDWVGAPVTLLEVIERHKATFCWLPNFAFNHLAMATRPGRSFDLSTVKAFINCSEPCKPESFEAFLRRFASCGVTPEQLQVCYAMAENVFAVTQTQRGAAARVFEVDRATFEQEQRAVAGSGLRLLSCGQPIEGVEATIHNDAGEMLPDGHIGEIVITSPFLFTGYNRQPDVTARKLRNGRYHTGDLGLIQDGELYVTGRTDDLLIAYGRNYYAHEIEQIASGVEGVVPGRSVAFAVDNAGAGTSRIVLMAETKEHGDITVLARNIQEAVLAGCGLALHQVVLRPPGTLVKTTSGKISREMNRLKYLELRDGGRSS